MPKTIYASLRMLGTSDVWLMIKHLVEGYEKVRAIGDYVLAHAYYAMIMC